MRVFISDSVELELLEFSPTEGVYIERRGERRTKSINNRNRRIRHYKIRVT